LVLGAFQVNCYRVTCEKTGESILIDPGDEAEHIWSETKKLDIKHILITHAHIDHIGAVAELQNHFHCRVWIHEKEKLLLTSAPLQAMMFGLPAPKSFRVERYLQDGDRIQFGSYEVQALAVPGHSPGSLAYLIPGHVFVGDTLFMDVIGRTDFPGCSHAVLLSSIKEKLFVLPGETKVYPGHGPATTIEREKRFNPFFEAAFD
jgi:hydroxyacylglutathione hydrolase